MHLAFFKKLAGGWGKKVLLIPFFAVFLMSQNTFAIDLSPDKYQIQTERTVGSIKVDNSTYNLSNYATSKQSVTVSANSSKYLQLQSLNLNNFINYADAKYFVVEYQINVWLPSSGSVSASAVCPQADYNYNFHVVDCNNTIIEQTDSSLIFRVKLFGDGSGNQNIIPFLGRFLIFDNASSSQQTFEWQFITIQSASYKPRTQDDAAAEAVDWQNQQYQQVQNNISGQSSSSFGNIDSQTTTNLIGVLSSFVSALQSISPDSSCAITLPFPVQVGGTWSVDPCSLPSSANNIIQVFGTLSLVAFFIPLVIVILHLIMNEIRRFQE